MYSIVKFLWGSSKEETNPETVESLKEILKLLRNNKVSDAITATKQAIALANDEVSDADDEMSDTDVNYKNNEKDFKRID